jgi:hypothetical protein
MSLTVYTFYYLLKRNSLVQTSRRRTEKQMGFGVEEDDVIFQAQLNYNIENSLDMPYINLATSHQNVNLYYEVHGSGEIKVLFIMGLATEGRAWKYQVRITET